MGSAGHSRKLTPLVAVALEDLSISKNMGYIEIVNGQRDCHHALGHGRNEQLHCGKPKPTPSRNLVLFLQGCAKKVNHFVHRDPSGLTFRIDQVAGKDRTWWLSLRLHAFRIGGAIGQLRASEGIAAAVRNVSKRDAWQIVSPMKR